VNQSGANGKYTRRVRAEAAVLERCGHAAREVESCLCLLVSYNQDLLKVILQEILKRLRLR
jgi:hypothetical protein